MTHDHLTYSIAQAAEDAKNLRAVNKQVDAVVDRVMWDAFPIFIRLDRDGAVSMLEEFALGYASVDKFRKLEIISLESSEEGHSSDPKQNQRSPSKISRKLNIEARKRLPKILPKALSVMSGLTSVK
ncbi:hypothetical protein AAF712_003939 [Marasmius tenuissimus]|uniref:Uncharacterized protein n=1 Tax=Marasmius tenuissimus TaxID=585030 RepID=A0ABR3A4N5_9AGAR